jgi:carbon monoxide dehydrogenase subunit G
MRVATTIRKVKRAVTVTREQYISADTAHVWAIVADPNMQERLDPRCRLEFASGDWRSAGSEFVLSVRGVRVRYVVSEAERGLRWSAIVDRGGRQAGVQRAELSERGAGTLLRWSVTMPLGPLVRGLAKRSCERELPRWLAAVEREALATFG